MSRLKNLYTYLITNRRGDVDGWLQSYRAITADVSAVKVELEQGRTLQDRETYAHTRVRDDDDPWRAFARQLLFERDNGISTRGQSTLSNENFDQFLNDQDFVDALTAMIRQPGRETFNGFSEAWERTRERLGANRNPLLVNRTLAACTLNVTSTVNTSYFESAYDWLVREGLINRHNDPDADWFDKNVQLMTFLREHFAEELRNAQTSDHLLSIFVWGLYENIANPFTLKKQIVKYGAPGTGKTYSAKRDTRLLFDIWREGYGQNTPYTHDSNCEVVQFHPSFGYEDFMEGLRPVLDGDGKAQLTLQNGVFKKFCLAAGKWEKDVYGIQGEGPKLAADWERIRIQHLRPYRERLTGEHWGFVFQDRVEDKRIAEVVPPYFFIIDEINRAELSRVLGELMLCLEYRGVDGAISTQYAGLNDETTGMIKVAGSFKFFIPYNVYVVGTMNTIDRSVESFDLALRRRFRWERTNPDLAALRYFLKQRDDQTGNASRPWLGLANDLEALNKHIRETDILGQDYEIGHAYIMKQRYPQTLTRSEVRENLWDDAIRPLLEEYLRGSGRSETLIPEFKKDFGIT
ncbi:MAG TPA: AAA family ATPase [Clostridia bacterium]|nr:AAA family ATPase [Clostridia bacterium]